MEEKTAQTQQTPTASPTQGQGPAIVSPGTPASNISPVAPPQKAEEKNKGLIIVAVVLVVLISILGIVYYLIIKQSSSDQTVTPPVVATPTTSVPSPTPSPTDEEVLDEENLEDPTVDITPLQQDATNL